MTTAFRRKPNRLPPHVYAGGYAFSLTLACYDRHQAFVDASVVDQCLTSLASSAQGRSVRIFAYCFMPDHLHLLAQAPRHVGIVGFVKAFKQSSGYWYRRFHGRPLWQKSYYDHAVRCEDGLFATARYVANNPVRANLVENADDYPFTGSLVWDRTALVEA